MANYINLLIHDEEFHLVMLMLIIVSIAVIWDVKNNSMWSLRELREKILDTRLNEEACTSDEILETINYITNEMIKQDSSHTYKNEMFFVLEHEIIEELLNTELPEHTIRLFKELDHLLTKSHDALVKRHKISA